MIQTRALSSLQQITYKDSDYAICFNFYLVFFFFLVSDFFFIIIVTTVKFTNK